tara:strand:- start:262 stop:591 length:330 start_codon:yes stop_codon:yes gene_type:complete
MTDPHYVNDLASLYASMHNPSSKERPLEEKYSHEKEPEWKKILRDEALKTRRQQPPYAQHHEEQRDASEEEEENSKASLAIKLVLELLGEEEHDEAAANALYMIRDLVK